MVQTNHDRPEKRGGLPPWAVNTIVAGIVVALLAAMVWLARELSHASAVIDCAARGIRNCQ